MSDDTPFNIWMNTAVNEIQTALDEVNPPVQRLHLFRCFQALAKIMEEVIKANAH